MLNATRNSFLSLFSLNQSETQIHFLMQWIPFNSVSLFFRRQIFNQLNQSTKWIISMVVLWVEELNSVWKSVSLNDVGKKGTIVCCNNKHIMLWTILPFCVSTVFSHLENWNWNPICNIIVFPSNGWTEYVTCSIFPYLC